jgi:hypothetical protein
MRTCAAFVEQPIMIARQTCSQQACCPIFQVFIISLHATQITGRMNDAPSCSFLKIRRHPDKNNRIPPSLCSP